MVRVKVLWHSCLSGVVVVVVMAALVSGAAALCFSLRHAERPRDQHLFICASLTHIKAPALYQQASHC